MQAARKRVTAAFNKDRERQQKLQHQRERQREHEQEQEREQERENERDLEREHQQEREREDEEECEREDERDPEERVEEVLSHKYLTRSATSSEKVQGSGKYKAIWTHDLTHFINPEASRKITTIITSDFKTPLVEFKEIKKTIEAREMVERWFVVFKECFHWDDIYENDCRRTFMTQCGSRLRNMLFYAREAAAKVTGSMDSACWRQVADAKPKWIDDSIWKIMCDKWACEKFQKSRNINKKNRNPQVLEKTPGTYCCGSISTNHHFRRLEAKLGRKPDLLEVYNDTHTIVTHDKSGEASSTRRVLLPAAQNFVSRYQAILRAESSDPTSDGMVDIDCFMRATNPNSLRRGRVQGVPGVKPRELQMSSSSTYVLSQNSSVVYTQQQIDELLEAEKQRTDQLFEEFRNEIKQANDMVSNMMNHRSSQPSVSTVSPMTCHLEN